jgi:hypothetical protein
MSEAPLWARWPDGSNIPAGSTVPGSLANSGISITKLQVKASYVTATGEPRSKASGAGQGIQVAGKLGNGAMRRPSQRGSCRDS